MWSRLLSTRSARRALSTSITSAYDAQIKSRGLVDEPTQRKLLLQLDALSASLCAPSSPSPPPRGLYLHGSPGCGKTFLVDLFFLHTNIPASRK